MNRLTTRKTSGLVLLSAAVLLNVGTAFGAEPADDAQAQAQALLSAASRGRADSAFPSSSAAGLVAAPDPQEQARGLLFHQATLTRDGGMREFEPMNTATSPASAQDRNSVRTSALDSARRMILGSGA